MTALLKGLGKLSKEERPKMGEAINQAKVNLQNLLTDRKNHLETLELEKRLLKERSMFLFQVEMLRWVVYTQSPLL